MMLHSKTSSERFTIFISSTSWELNLPYFQDYTKYVESRLSSSNQLRNCSGTETVASSSSLHPYDKTKSNQ